MYIVATGTHEFGRFFLESCLSRFGSMHLIPPYRRSFLSLHTEVCLQTWPKSYSDRGVLVSSSLPFIFPLSSPPTRSKLPHLINAPIRETDARSLTSRFLSEYHETPVGVSPPSAFFIPLCLTGVQTVMGWGGRVKVSLPFAPSPPPSWLLIPSIPRPVSQGFCP